jgi:hypothetical protein
MTTRRLAGLCVFLLFRAYHGRAAVEANPVYTELRAARPKGDAVSVQGLTLERDAFRFRFESGTFEFLPPVDGRSVGAVFVGKGTMELHPASKDELRYLAFVTNEKTLEVLTETFESLVLLYSDSTEAEIRQAGKPSSVAGRWGDVYQHFLKDEQKDFRRNLDIRLLQDVLEKPETSRGTFLAYVDGKKYSTALVAVDPTGLEWLTGLSGPETSLYYPFDERKGGLWYYSASIALAQSENIKSPLPRAKAVHYAIDTTIQKNDEIHGITTIELVPSAPGLRVLPIELRETLRIKEASFSDMASDAWTPAAVIQENEKEDSDAAIVFPTPLAQSHLRLRLLYEGKGVLHEIAEGVYSVGARFNWYPNLGTFADLSSYDLVYRFPKSLEIVSVGVPVEEHVDGDTKISTWKQERPIRVAGFNYGRFQKVEKVDPESGITVDIFASRRVGNAELLQDSAMADGFNTARVGTHYFGPLPQKRVSIAQTMELLFGQSFPSLVYLPSSVAFDTPNRRSLVTRDVAAFVDQVGSHEFAHQWWGHLVGWETYRDQWLSEGFAEFTSALVQENAGGMKEYKRYWERARELVTEKSPPQLVANNEAGPITLGNRLMTWRNSFDAYNAMVYTKGAYVLHMLRMMMRGHTPDPDANFIAMMKDFASSYADKNPSTRDFQKVVERHMTQGMNLTGDGKLDWFFRQWVYGMEIPRFKQKLDVAPVSADQYKIVGSVSQEAVSPDFWTLVQVYVEFPKGEIAHLGTLSLKGTTTTPVDVTVKLPKAPKRVVLNAFNDVLSLN